MRRPSDKRRFLTGLGGWRGLALVVVVGSAPAVRGEEIPEHFHGVRPMGMGDAFTAVANDENAIWTNPAGIGRSRKARSRNVFNLTKVPNIIAGANSEGRAFYEGYKSSQDKSVEAVVDNADDLGDKPFWARASMFPVTLFDVSRDTPMSFGLYSNTTVKAVIPKDTPEEARVEAVSDMGGVLGFGITNNSNRFNIGFQVRPVMRYAYEDRVPSEMLLDKKAMQDEMAAEANKSQAVAADFGMMYTVADFWFPTIGVAVLNLPTGCRDDYLNPFSKRRETVCGTVFKGEFANEDALSTVDPTDVRAGVSITPRIGRKLNMRFALDVHHLPIGTSEMSYGLLGIEASKLVHAGVELFVGNPLLISPFSLRAGYSQGFATGGFSLNLGPVLIEFATYGRDVSSTSKPIEDRRMMASLSFDF